MNIDLSKLRDDIVNELKVIHIMNGKSLTKEEYIKVLQHITNYCYQEKRFLREARIRVTGIRLLSMIGTFKSKNFKEIQNGAKVMSKGAKTSSKNFKEVLKGVRLTSNFFTVENIQNVVMQHEAAKKYHYDYVSYTSDFCSKVMYPQEINPFLESESYTESMKENRQKVLTFSKKYQTKTP